MSRQIFFQNGKVCELIIESPQLFGKYVQELRGQIEGAEGRFVLSDEEREYDISKSVDFIIDPLAVNINEKKILNKLYSELEKMAYGEDFFIITQEILANIHKYFSDLEHTSPYILHIGDNIEMSHFFRALDVKVEDYAENYLERLNQYIKILAELLKRNLLVLVNLRSYLEDEQLMQLLDSAAYSEINILLIENVQRKLLDGIAYYIIDFDGCEI